MHKAYTPHAGRGTAYSDSIVSIVKLLSTVGKFPSQLRSLYRLLETVDFDPIRVRDIYWNRMTNQQNLNSIRQLASLDLSSLANLMPSGCVEGNGPYLLFGRELIQLFDIIVHGDKVSRGCKVLNDEFRL